MPANDAPAHLPNRVYILTREDLTPAQAVVQTAHALAELMLKHGEDP